MKQYKERSGFFGLFIKRVIIFVHVAIVEQRDGARASFAVHYHVTEPDPRFQYGCCWKSRFVGGDEWEYH